MIIWIPSESYCLISEQPLGVHREEAWGLGVPAWVGGRPDDTGRGRWSFISLEGHSYTLSVGGSHRAQSKMPVLGSEGKDLPKSSDYKCPCAGVACTEQGAAVLTCALQTAVTTGCEHLHEVTGLEVSSQFRMVSASAAAYTPPTQLAPETPSACVLSQQKAVSGGPSANWQFGSHQATCGALPQQGGHALASWWPRPGKSID